MLKRSASLRITRDHHIACQHAADEAVLLQRDRIQRRAGQRDAGVGTELLKAASRLPDSQQAFPKCTPDDWSDKGARFYPLRRQKQMAYLT